MTKDSSNVQMIAQVTNEKCKERALQNKLKKILGRTTLSAQIFLLMKMRLKVEFKHKPVLLNECIEGLEIKPDGIYVDGTLRWSRT